MKISNDDAIWAACFIDCEGYIGVYRRKRRANGYTFVVGGASTDTRAVRKMQRILGGSVYPDTPPKKSNWNQGWRWMLSNKQAAEALELLLPYFVIKREQAELALEFRKYKRKPKQEINYDHEDRKEEIVSLLKWLKRNPVQDIDR